MDATHNDFTPNPAFQNTQNSNGAGSVVLPKPTPTEERPDAQPPQPPQKTRQRFKRIAIAAALSLGAIVGGSFGYNWWRYASTHQETDNATVTGHLFQISSRIPGTVLNVPVDDNELVQAGELLVKLDPKDYQVKVQQAQAALAVAQRQAEAAQAGISLAGQTTQGQTTEAQGNLNRAVAAISTAQAAVNEAQAGVPVAQAQLQEAVANLQRVQADYARYQTLFSSGAISRQQLDASRAAYETAVAQRNAAQQGVSQAQAKLAQAQQGVTQAQAELASSRGGLEQAQAGNQQTEVNRRQYAAATASIAQAEASLAEAQLQLSYTDITAPVAGRIGRKTVETGERIQAGQPLMAVVGNDIWVVANFKETQIEKMHPGQTVEVDLDAFPHHAFVGRVDSLSPASGAEFALLPPDNATGNFTKVVQRIPVKIVLDADSVKGFETQITPGMSATVAVEVE